MSQGLDFAPAVGAHPGGAVVTVWVVPGASRSQVAGMHGDAVRVRVAAAPERGRANRAVADLVGAVAGAPVEVVGGERHRRKQLLVRGADPTAVAGALAAAWEQLGARRR